MSQSVNRFVLIPLDAVTGGYEAMHIIPFFFLIILMCSRFCKVLEM